MDAPVLGRTNKVYPRIWLRPVFGEPADLEGLPASLLSAGTVIDVTAMPSILGRYEEDPHPQPPLPPSRMQHRDARRGGSLPTPNSLSSTRIFEERGLFLYRGGRGVENAKSADHAADLMGAEIIEVVSSLCGRPLEFFVWRVGSPLEDFQIEGALGALSTARSEGLIRSLGLGIEGPAAMPVWKLNDAFDIVLVARNHLNSEPYDLASPMAASRRVGVVTDRAVDWDFGMPFTYLPSLWRLPNLSKGFYGVSVEQAVVARFAADHPVIVCVRSAGDVEAALATVDTPEGVDAYVEPFVSGWGDESEWALLSSDGRAWVREAAARRARCE